MNKLSYILTFLILSLLVVIGVTVFVKNKNVSVALIAPVYTDFSVTLPSTTGPKVTVPNFLKNNAVIEDAQNPGLYFIGNTFPTATSTNSPTYIVTYDKTTAYFNIALLSKPLSSARNDAELYIRNLLKVDDSSLCGLSYTVSVPGYVDEAASGVDYRFSFCLDTIKLP